MMGVTRAGVTSPDLWRVESSPKPAGVVSRVTGLAWCELFPGKDGCTFNKLPRLYAPSPPSTCLSGSLRQFLHAGGARCSEATHIMQG